MKTQIIYLATIGLLTLGSQQLYAGCCCQQNEKAKGTIEAKVNENGKGPMYRGGNEMDKGPMMGRGYMGGRGERPEQGMRGKGPMGPGYGKGKMQGPMMEGPKEQKGYRGGRQ